MSSLLIDIIGTYICGTIIGLTGMVVAYAIENETWKDWEKNLNDPKMQASLKNYEKTKEHHRQWDNQRKAFEEQRKLYQQQESQRERNYFDSQMRDERFRREQDALAFYCNTMRYYSSRF